MKPSRRAAIGLTTLSVAPFVLAAANPADDSSTRRVATQAPNAATRVVEGELLVPLVFRAESAETYYAFNGSLNALGYSERDEALRKATWLHIDRLSGPTEVVFPDGKCLTNVADGSAQRAAKATCADGSPKNQMWTVGADTLTIGSPIVAGKSAVSYALPTAAGLAMRSPAGEYVTFKGATWRRGVLGAQVKSTDSSTGSALIGGTARPNSTLRVGGDAQNRVPVASSGAWSYEATGLKPGKSTIRFDEYVGSVKSATTTAKVTIEGESTPTPEETLTLEHPADASIGYPTDRPFTFSGGAEPGKTVEIHNFKGLFIASAETNSDGEWSYTRERMLPYTWQLDFTVDRDTPDEQRVILRNFGPQSG